MKRIFAALMMLVFAPAGFLVGFECHAFMIGFVIAGRYLAELREEIARKTNAE
jgi:hypothetical protein